MKIQIKTIQQYLLMILALLLIMDLNSVYSRFSSGALPTPAICIGLTFLLFITSCIERKWVNLRTLLVLLIYYAYLAIFIILSPKANLTGFIMKFAVLIPLLICFFTTDIRAGKLLLKYYASIMVVLALISLIFFPFTNLLNVIPPVGEVTVHWRGNAPFNNYFFVFFNNGYSNYTSWLIRNTGIFVEAPQYGLNLILALMYELGVNKDVAKKHVFILVLAILTTVSFGSIMTMLLMFYTRFLMTDPKSRSLRKLKIFLSIGLLFIVAVALIYLLNKKMGNGNSFSIRVDDFASGFQSWRLHPIIGNGYGNTKVIQQFVGSFRSWSLRNNVIGFSNSWAMILSNGGLMLILIYLWSIVSFFKSSFQNIWNRFLIILTLALMLTLNAFAYSTIVIVLTALGVSVKLADSYKVTHVLK